MNEGRSASTRVDHRTAPCARIEVVDGPFLLATWVNTIIRGWFQQLHEPSRRARSKRDAKVSGRQGRRPLLANNDTNMVVKQTRAELSSADTWVSWTPAAHPLRNRTSWTERLGADVTGVLIPPNPHTSMPRRCRRPSVTREGAPLRSSSAISSESGRRGGALPLDVLLAARMSSTCMRRSTRTGTGVARSSPTSASWRRWTLGLQSRRLTDADVGQSSEELEGDLGHKVDPPRTGHRPMPTL